MSIPLNYLGKRTLDVTDISTNSVDTKRLKVDGTSWPINGPPTAGQIMVASSADPTQLEFQSGGGGGNFIHVPTHPTAPDNIVQWDSFDGTLVKDGGFTLNQNLRDDDDVKFGSVTVDNGAADARFDFDQSGVAKWRLTHRASANTVELQDVEHGHTIWKAVANQHGLLETTNLTATNELDANYLFLGEPGGNERNWVLSGNHADQSLTFANAANEPVLRVKQDGLLQVSKSSLEINNSNSAGADPSIEFNRADTGSNWKVTYNAGDALSFLDSSGQIKLYMTPTSSTIRNELIMQNDRPIHLGETASPVDNNCVAIKLQLGNLIPVPAARVIKISNVGGAGKAQQIVPSDPQSTGIVGVSITGGTQSNETIQVAVAGQFKVSIEQGITVVPGDHLEPSNFQPGRVTNGIPGIGTFAVALTGGTGSADGSVVATAIFRKNEGY